MDEEYDVSLWRPLTALPAILFLASLEGWNDPQELHGPIKLTQDVIEAVHGADANIQLTAEVIEAVHGGTAQVQITQNVIESVHGASPNVDISQFIIEIVVHLDKPFEDYFWTRPIIHEFDYGRPILGANDEVVRSVCRCVAVPGMSVCVHGNPMNYFDCVSGAPPTYASPLIGIEIPCES